MQACSLINFLLVLGGACLGQVLSGEDLVEVNTSVDDREKGPGSQSLASHRVARCIVAGVSQALSPGALCDPGPAAKAFLHLDFLAQY